MYVYIKSEPRLWTVGFYDPKGRFQSESDWDNTEDAADRVAYLNGNPHEPDGSPVCNARCGKPCSHYPHC